MKKNKTQVALTYLGIDLFISSTPVSAVPMLLFRNEFWKDCAEWEYKYKVSTLGNVKRKARINERGDKLKERSIKIAFDKSGYKIVSLSRVRHTCNRSVHSLVLKTFIPNPENKPECNHKDADKGNSYFLNLEWCTHLENMKHASEMGLIHSKKGITNPSVVLTESDVIQIREFRKNNPHISYREISEKYGVDRSTIYLIVKRKKWKHI